MNLSIIIPAGRPETARQTVASILEQSFLPDDVQIILAGCGLDGLVRHFSDSRIQVVQLQNRCNPAETRIAGIKAAEREWYLFVDDDIKLDRLFLEKLSTIIAEGKNVGAVGARLPGSEKTYFSRVTDLTNFWSQQSVQTGERDWLYSAVLAVPAAIYHKVGGFNPELAIGEDVDLTRRIKAAGYGVYYQAELVGYHNHRRTTLMPTLSYFRQNGGLALYQFKSNRQLRVWSAKHILRNSMISLWNTIKLNRREVEKFYLYLPGIAMMYLVFFMSMEFHLNTYTTRFIKEGSYNDTLNDCAIGSFFLKNSLEDKRAGKNIRALFSLAMAYVHENFLVVSFFLLIVLLFLLCLI